MMRHQKMSFTIKDNNLRKCQRFERQFLNILVLSIIWTMLFTQTMARPNTEPLLSNKRTNNVVEQQQQEQNFYLNEITANTNNEKLFNKMQKYHHNQPNYLNKWPGLRNLVSTLDYDDNNDLEDSNEILNTRFLERLRHLAAPKNYYDDSDDPAKTLNSSASLFSNQMTFKDHNSKKNVQFRKQYMSPCHFKICNMGHKREDRFFQNN